MHLNRAVPLPDSLKASRAERALQISGRDAWTMSTAKNAILSQMLDRLYAGLATGPNLNCRPHSSRQRVDWMQLGLLQDHHPLTSLRSLIRHRATRFQAMVPPPPSSLRSLDGEPAPSSESLDELSRDLPDSAEEGVPENMPTEPGNSHRAARSAWGAQQALLGKLRGLIDDARDYLQETGVHVLHVGFPLLSLPVMNGPGPAAARRLLAPIAFLPVTIELRGGARPTVVIEGLNDGEDFVIPNEALFSWLERQTGVELLSSEQAADSEDFRDEPTSTDPPIRSRSSSASDATDPWHEVSRLVRRVTTVLRLPPVDYGDSSPVEWIAAPRADQQSSDPEILPAAVLGLFPMSNQGLLRDTQAMLAHPETLTGPLLRFLSSSMEVTGEEPAAARSDPGDTRLDLVTAADPCQAHAVRLARSVPGLVVHGPPGTGKSQTITNMIGDHLARGERVLLVCDKRTALDVVARRLDHLGLGGLYALIHDPQHDQRTLYKSIREQLEGLSDQTMPERAERKLNSLDSRLNQARATLTDAHGHVMQIDATRGVSFHERMGEWLATAPESGPVPGPSLKQTTRSRRASAPRELSPEMLESHESAIREILQRGSQIRFAQHPWVPAVGTTLDEFLKWSPGEIQAELQAWRTLGQDVDDSPLSDTFPILSEGAAVSASMPDWSRHHLVRSKLIDVCRKAITLSPALRLRFLTASENTIEIWSKRWEQICGTSEAGSAWHILEASPPEPQLDVTEAARGTTPADWSIQYAELQCFLDSCDQWYSWLLVPTWWRAHALAREYGLPPTEATARRLRQYLGGRLARATITSVLAEITGVSLADELASLRDQQQALETLFELRRLLREPEITSIASRIQAALHNEDWTWIQGLQATLPRLQALDALSTAMSDSGLLHATWREDLLRRAAAGEPVTPTLRTLAQSTGTLEDLLRIDAKIQTLPTELQAAVRRVLEQPLSVEAGLQHLRHEALSADLADWIQTCKPLQNLDAMQLEGLYRDVWRMEQERQALVCDRIRSLWIERQRSRLLASTGSRLNSLGADLRRRLTLRGERAMRLRQVLAVGDRIEGGDPIFDVRPIWMASPETVAQIFPRHELFDVVIFDEASQCRLEEALPVLTRARRVVIAGDPRQLPPTRFFESAAVTSDSVAAETDQEWFEAHQGEVEDLLTAALSLDLDETYLDVHYRSQHAELIAFSNQYFYGSRLQAVPLHPRRRMQRPPITLHPVAGLYQNRQNHAEAEAVCQLVRELLSVPEPPSIGIACFNLSQRDLILSTLDAHAAEDDQFGSLLATARTRTGASTFEGLFVKNLENVQGDERDHLIISTTYGPDADGRFYQRFGPLGQSGGGRRLNVLVTRARQHVHLVTSAAATACSIRSSCPCGSRKNCGDQNRFRDHPCPSSIAVRNTSQAIGSGVFGYRVPSQIRPRTRSVGWS